MASLSICYRHTPRTLLHARQVVSTQSRTYIRRLPKEQYKKKARAGPQEGGAEVAAPRRKKDTAFLPMSSSQLTHPLFEPEHPDRLQLQLFHPEILTSSVEAQALAFPHNDKDPFRIFGLPRNLLIDFRILSKPCSVVRGITIDVINRLDVAYQSSSANHRLVLSGPSGCGKSVLLLQALQYCQSRDWIVFYFPRGINLVNSTTTYAYDPRTRLYQQPTFAFQTLQRVLTVNSKQLDQLKTTVDVEFERRATIPPGTTLSELVRAAVREPALAPTVLAALIEELQKQEKFPVLMAIDDFQAIYCKTMYRDPYFSRIRPYHLSIPRILLEFASGQRAFARGAVVGALSTLNVDFKIPVELAEALDVPPATPAGPYVERSTTMQQYAQGLERVAVPEALTVAEAMEVFDVWRKDGALPSTANDEFFLSKYSESCGNAREFVWKGLLRSISL